MRMVLALAIPLEDLGGGFPHPAHPIVLPDSPPIIGGPPGIWPPGQRPDWPPPVVGGGPIMPPGIWPPGGGGWVPGSNWPPPVVGGGPVLPPGIWPTPPGIWPTPPGIWPTPPGGGPGGGQPPTPTHPIVLPPPGSGTLPSAPAYIIVWIPGYGWASIPVPVGVPPQPTPPPEVTPQPTPPPPV